MDISRREVAIGVIVIIILLCLLRQASSYASPMFDPSMSLQDAEVLHDNITKEIGEETAKKLDDAHKRNDLAAMKKIGDEGHQAIQKLQEKYHAFITAKGLKIEVN
jgi:hypothetical protein